MLFFTFPFEYVFIPHLCSLTLRINFSSLISFQMVASPDKKKKKKKKKKQKKKKKKKK